MTRPYNKTTVFKTMPPGHVQAAVNRDAWTVYIEWRAAQLQRHNEALRRRNQRLFQSLMFAHNLLRSLGAVEYLYVLRTGLLKEPFWR